ncbi:hypothetical protein VPDG_00068 [Vibrio phage henriette 12B8]|uniref:hypothetical protein n=1 Tax=Vibrio phage henriette 12B8 TaxID=573174 RepID=UPI0002C15D55|nr:hypothetical protein VPDG_00068 [Vibrio phage henriette 12B8]AGG58229.1 hypothetical protein VPDG_00068 [Vibrio phage henriette 12B8]
MENNVDRYAEVMKDLLFIANARIEVKAATNRLKKNLTVHELSDKPCCDRSDAKYALNKLLNDDLIGELRLDFDEKRGKFSVKGVYKNFVMLERFEEKDGGAELIASLIRKVGKKTIMEDAL